MRADPFQVEAAGIVVEVMTADTVLIDAGSNRVSSILGHCRSAAGNQQGQGGAGQTSGGKCGQLVQHK